MISTRWLALLVVSSSLFLSKRVAVYSEVSTSSSCLSTQMLALGSATIDAQTGTVACKGYLNQVEGPIELLACTPDGKVHESIFVLNVNPADLQTGLLLLGLAPGEPPPALGSGPIKGPRVEIWVDWEEAGQTRTERAERFIYNMESQSALSSFGWVFTGSMLDESGFKASAEGSLVATYVDPWAILNIPLPYGLDDEMLTVNSPLCPPIRTSVVVRFRRASTPP